MQCEICGQEIPVERLEVIPGCTTCVEHSREVQKVALLEYGHKTAGSVVVIDGNDTESVRRAFRAYRRSR